MSGVRREPLTLEVALAHYVATLGEGEEVPLAQLSRDFGCSEEDIRLALAAIGEVEDRDLTFLSGAYIEGDRLVKKVSGGYERPFRNPVRLSAVQARAALLALDLVRGAADAGILQSLRNKVRGAAGGEFPEVEVGTRQEEDAPIIAAIERARRERRVLEISYPSGASGEPTLRPVEPLLMSSIDGIWYLNSYCRRAEAGRLFRLERILSARVLEERFEPRAGVPVKTDFADIDPRTYAARRAVVRFSAAVARWMEERPELDLLEKHPDGSADYALYYTDPAWAARRVMQYAGEAVVIEPDELRREVLRICEDLLEAYGEEAP